MGLSIRWAEDNLYADQLSYNATDMCLQLIAVIIWYNYGFPGCLGLERYETST